MERGGSGGGGEAAWSENIFTTIWNQFFITKNMNFLNFVDLKKNILKNNVLKILKIQSRNLDKIFRKFGQKINWRLQNFWLYFQEISEKNSKKC